MLVLVRGICGGVSRVVVCVSQAAPPSSGHRPRSGRCITHGADGDGVMAACGARWSAESARVWTSKPCLLRYTRRCAQREGARSAREVREGSRLAALTKNVARE